MKLLFDFKTLLLVVAVITMTGLTTGETMAQPQPATEISSVETLKFWKWGEGQTVEDQLHDSRAVGSPFSRHLFKLYRHLLNDPDQIFRPSQKVYNHFRRKAIVSAEGDIIMPEPLDHWKMESDDQLFEAHARLMGYLSAGGRAFAPRDMARTQFYYECWLMAKAGYIFPPMAQVCQERFKIGLNDVEITLSAFKPDRSIKESPLFPDAESQAGRVPSRAEAERRGAVHSTPIIPLEDAKYFVFFDFDKSNLDETAERVIEAAAEQIQSRSDLGAVITAGHADRSGPVPYNRRLSLDRAQTVRQSLIKEGVDENLVKIRALGESTPLVPTADGVKEPANRRVEITFE